MKVVDNGELARLRGDHEAIRAQLRFLAEELDGLKTQEIPVKELIWKYRMGINDLREAMQNHAEFDIHVFDARGLDVQMERTAQEHKMIAGFLDEAFWLSDAILDTNLSEAKLNKVALKIRSSFDYIYKLISIHTEKEEELLNPTPEDM